MEDGRLTPEPESKFGEGQNISDPSLKPEPSHGLPAQQVLPIEGSHPDQPVPYIHMTQEGQLQQLQGLLMLLQQKDPLFLIPQ